ncbi:SUKH-4 family immunity protein [Streptomyces sp. NPDC049879]|uniref:SUKH-4 family immunity protein n=1 Tax=Streptomyces sp. NPDC049879 TaxID=3365598 RepID=UPI0037B24BD9
MMVTYESLVLAFPDDDVTVASLVDLPVAVTDPTARRVLTEVGLPEHVEQSLWFEELDTPLVTVASSGSGPSAAAVARAGDFYVIGVSTAGLLCLDGASGECYFVDGDGNVLLAATRLDLLLEFVWRLKTGIDAGHLGEGWAQSLVGELRELDPVTFAASEGKWREVVAACHAIALS